MYNDAMCVLMAFIFTGGIIGLSYFVFKALLNVLWKTVCELANWAGE